MKDSSYEYADDVISKATMFAIAAHSGQFRKDGITPAIIHAMEASVIVSTLTGDQDVMAAALLHDTVEDTDVTAEQLNKMFGDKVSALVAAETEDKHKEMSASESWNLRKKVSIDELKSSTDKNIKILWLGDKLSNMRSFYRSYLEKGKAMWNDFNQKDEKMQEWYYREIADALSEFKDTAAYTEYIYLMNKIFEKDN